MKICIISGLYPPYAKGGAEAVAASAAYEFKAVGHDVYVITAKPFRNLKSLWPEKIIEDGITIYRFFPLNLFFYGNIGQYHFLLRVLWHLMDIWNIHASICLAHILKKVWPDIVATHNLKGFSFITPSTLYGVRRDKKISYKWIHTLHDVQLVSPSGLLRPGEEKRLINRIFSFLTLALFLSPDVVVSPSKWLLDFYTSRGFFSRSEKKIILNPINSHIRGIRIHSRDSHYNFLYLGQIEEHKGILFLIDTFKQFISSKSYKLKAISCALTIAGDGSLLEEVKRRANIPEIKVLGRVPHEKISELFETHNAIIVPSLVYENAPAVISESLTYSVPVIASNIGGIPEMIEEGATGLLFEPGNTFSLISAMEKLITSPLPILVPQPRPNYVSEFLSL